MNSINTDWTKIRLKYLLAAPVTDGPHSTPNFIESGIPFVSVDGIQDGELVFNGKRFISSEDHEEFKKKTNPERGDILLGKAASVGKVALIKTDTVFSIWSPLALLKPDKRKIKPKILEYSLKTRNVQDQIEVLSNSNTQKNLGMKDIPNLVITLPNINLQNKIVSFLDYKLLMIRNLIEKNQKQIELLEEKKQAVINQAVTKGLDPNVKMKDSGVEWIGEIPEHWELKKLKYLLKRQKDALKPGPFGSDIKNSDLIDSGIYKVYTQRNVLDHKYDENLDSITEGKFESLKNFEITPGDILLTTRGTIGYASVFPVGMARGILHPCLIRIRINEEIIKTEWLINYFNESSIFRTNVQYNSNSTVIDVIYGYTLREIVVPVPTVAEQSKINMFVKEQSELFSHLITKIEKQNELLREYRQALISNLVTGKIDVRDEKIPDKYL